jgi:putative addiction module antidote
MVRRLKLRRAGGSVSAVIPKDALDRLHLAAGDEVFLVETEQGLLLTPYDPTFEQAMIAYGDAAKRYRNALKALANK